MIRYALLVALAGCSSIECDPSGACWPKEYDHNRPIKIYEVDDVKSIDPFKRDIYAFSLTDVGPTCLIFVPKTIDQQLAYSGWSKELLLKHEVGHCNGVTVHKGE